MAAALHKAAFGRLPNDSALEEALGLLRSGVSFDDLALTIAASPEFTALHGPSKEVDTIFLAALHRAAFEREPEPGWFESILGVGDKAKTRGQVLASVSRSEEVLLSLVPPPIRELVGADRPARLIHSLYRTALGRNADASGLTGYLKEFKRKPSIEKLAKSIAGSPEFQRRHGIGSKIDLKLVMDLYRDALARQPALEEASHWLTDPDKKSSRAGIVAALAGSEEALERMRPKILPASEKYSGWVRNNDTISDADRSAIRSQIDSLSFRPFFSVILSNDSSSPNKLFQSLDSMSNQLYPNWEVCLAIDPVTESILKNYSDDAEGPRIRLIQVDATASRAMKLNAALASSAADYVTFLRSGDSLSEEALFEVAFEIGKGTELDIIYTDCDWINLAGRRLDPWFKTGWDLELLLSHDYLNDLTVYRRALIKELGWMRSGISGAEFYDLALRAAAATTSARIRHLPAILYHRGDEAGSSSAEIDFLHLEALVARSRVVRDFLDAAGYASASIIDTPGYPGAQRILWPLPDPEPLVSIIIPTRDRGDLVASCVDGIRHRTAYSNLEILIVDNDSTERESLAVFERLAKENSRIRILSSAGPFNYASLTNQGARDAQGEILLLLNNDIEVMGAGWLREMVSLAVRPEVGAVGAKLLYQDGTIQHAGIVLGPNGAAMHQYRFSDRNDPGYFGQAALTRTVLAVTAACLAIRRPAFFEVGGLDADNLAIAYNDVDLCLKLVQAGYRVLWTPFAELYHLESVSRGRDDATPVSQARSEREWRFLRAKWKGLLENEDPFHNPNLLFKWDHLEIPSSPRRQKPWYSILDGQLS
jgi:GT2 family glycosyltransferase